MHFTSKLRKGHAISPNLPFGMLWGVQNGELFMHVVVVVSVYTCL